MDYRAKEKRYWKIFVDSKTVGNCEHMRACWLFNLFSNVNPLLYHHAVSISELLTILPLSVCGIVADIYYV